MRGKKKHVNKLKKMKGLMLSFRKAKKKSFSTILHGAIKGIISF
jgi:hypothetical protein